MDSRNQRGQILIEVIWVALILMATQVTVLALIEASSERTRKASLTKAHRP